jgi:GT2 family glycosyltransferase
VAEPRFSVITPVYDTPADVFWAMIGSVLAQTHGDWELCLVDDCSPSPHVAELLAQAEAADPRIRVGRRTENGGIVAASNDALAMARGEFLAMLDHDDELHPDALAHVHEALVAEPEADYVYTDEDKIDRAGHHSGPFFKPDWSPERMRTQMYSCHLSVFRRSLVEAVGGFDPAFEGSQDWDMVLKVTERARAVLHVPRVLYHWRTLETSAAGGGEAAKPWAFEAGKRAIQAHCERIGLPARCERDETDPGVYHLVPELRTEPLVSIVIPTAGTKREIRYEQVVLVEHCVRSIVESSSYRNFEIVCVVDEGTDVEVLDRLREIAGERLRLALYEAPFNFSAKINLGAAESAGEHLLLLNDDMEVVTPDWIERMVMYSGIPEVGAVGGRLLWGDGRLQHVGVRLEQGLPGHPYRGFSGEFKGYGNSVRVAGNCMAVTGACLMTRRDLFEQVGGLPTDLPVNYNDVDYCLKLRRAGKRVVYDPDLVLFHFESSSRSSEVEQWEKELFLERWLPFSAVDPYANPNMRHEMPRLSAPFKWAIRRRPWRRRPKGQLV